MTDASDDDAIGKQTKIMMLLASQQK